MYCIKRMLLMHYNMFSDCRNFAEITDVKEMYLVSADTIKTTAVKFMYTLKFRKFAELFYFVMFPAFVVKGFLYSILIISANRP